MKPAQPVFAVPLASVLLASALVAFGQADDNSPQKVAERFGYTIVTTKILDNFPERVSGKKIALLNAKFEGLSPIYLNNFPGVTVSSDGLTSMLDLNYKDQWFGFSLRDKDGERCHTGFAFKQRFSEVFLSFKRNTVIHVFADGVTMHRMGGQAGFIVQAVFPQRPDGLSTNEINQLEAVKKVEEATAKAKAAATLVPQANPFADEKSPPPPRKPTEADIEARKKAEDQRRQETDKKVVAFLKANSAKGYDFAQYDLALRHLDGRGVPQDHVEAKRLLEQAAAHGYKKAKAKLEELNADK